MNHQRALWSVTFIIISILSVSASYAETCLAPSRPFVPSDPADAREYADLIRRDFETYLTDVQSYFRCLEVERMRVFLEAKDVAQEYERFLSTSRLRAN